MVIYSEVKQLVQGAGVKITPAQSLRPLTWCGHERMRDASSGSKFDGTLTHIPPLHSVCQLR